MSAGPGMQRPPPSQLSMPSQRLPSEQEVPTATGVCLTPVAGSHESVVQGFPSSTAGAVPATQEPAPLHVSAPLHALLSEQEVPAATGTCLTPIAGSHESVVH